MKRIGRGVVGSVVVAALVALFATACATDDTGDPGSDRVLVQEEFGSLDQVLRYHDLYLASEADDEVLELAARRGFRAVLDLRDDETADERPLGPHARRVGLVYVHVAVDPTALDDAAVDRALAALEPNGDERGPVLVFGGTVDSPAAVFAIHRAVVDGAAVEEALADGRAAGLKPGVSEAQVTRQVERLRSANAASADATNAETTESISESSSDDGGNA